MKTQTQFWNLIIKAGGLLAGIGWHLSLAGDSIMELGRLAGMGALHKLRNLEVGK